MGFFSKRKPPAKPVAQPSAKVVPLAAANAARSNPPAPARPPTDTHILHTFDDALNDLVAKTTEMGAHVARMVRNCGPAFAGRDAAAAREIIQADTVVDKQKDAVMQATVEALARHRPVASDLRLILAAEHVAGNLERAADHAKNIAKRTLSVGGGAKPDAAMGDLMTRLHRAVSLLFEDALRAFEKGDTKLAAEVLRRDSEPDALYDDLFHGAIAKLQTGKSDAAIDVHALFVGKSLERIGDHATNIAEEVRFLTRGDIPPATRPS